MGKGLKHLEGRTQKERQQVRKNLGSLRSLTVQPKTRQRYEKARDRFYQFLDSNQLVIPKKRQAMDVLICEYLEAIWAAGEGRALASDTLAGLQDADPHLRGCIPPPGVF